jgi:hypothetical protein
LGAERTGIDDGKAPVAEHDPPIGGRPQAVTVRTSAPLQLAQARNDSYVVSASLRGEAERTCYCAHFKKFERLIRYLEFIA